MTKGELQQQALSKAVSGQSLANYPAIILGFTGKGIPADQIEPRSNVFTYHAWRALGRQVRKGEHGVRVCTYVPMTKAVDNGDGTKGTEHFKRPRMTTVFHVSQTDPVQA